MQGRTILTFFSVSILIALSSSALEPNRTAKALGLFSVIKFKNSECITSDKKAGTCYTKKECEEKGGVPSGTCASSYGTCCAFNVGCGQTSSENNTYFSGPQPTSDGSCPITICPCNDNICQLRLDFDRFSTVGPSNRPKGVQNYVDNGAAHYSSGNPVALMICDTDAFSISNPGHSSPPVICGQNDGAHMYVEVSKSCCTELNMYTDLYTAAGRAWDIRITQIGCDSKLLAPQGCTQYFYNTDGTGLLKTFNFDGGQHLGDQRQRFCMRRERGMCRICYTVVEENDFQVTNSFEGTGYTGSSYGYCIGYSYSGSSAAGADGVVLPDASYLPTPNAFTPDQLVSGYKKIDAIEFCGNPSSGLHIADDSDGPYTLCSNRLPFTLDFFSDIWENEYEYDVENGYTEQPNAGFRLVFSQRAC